MKTLEKQTVKLTTLLLFLCSLFMLTMACSKDDAPKGETPDSPIENPDGSDQEPEPEPLDTLVIDSDKVTQSLIFDNMNIITGTPPSVNTLTSKLVSDLKIDRDTIFWTEGIIKRLLVKRPEDLLLKGFWVYVEGAHSYIEATFREEEETEEIDVLYFDFDPTEWDLDFSFPLDIIPFDEDGNALDKIETAVEIEEALDSSGICEFSYTYENDDNFDATEWQWIFSHDPDIDFLAAPMFPFNTSGSTQGCCSDEGQSSQNPNCPSSNITTVNYQNYYTIDNEIFYIIPADGNFFLGWSGEATRNFDPEASDFCELKARYIEDSKINGFEGNWVIDSDCNLVFTYTRRDPFVYVGSKFRPISKHYIEEVREAGPDGGGSLRRVYEMITAIRKGEETPFRSWYD